MKIKFILFNIFITIMNFSYAQVISGGTAHTLVRCSSGTVSSWGANSGQLGDNTTTQRNAPVQMDTLTNVNSVAAGHSHSLILKNDGSVWSCGINSDGQLGDGTTVSKKTPIQVIGLSGIIAIAVGTKHSIALKNDGTVWTWGSNYFGQIGMGAYSSLEKNPIQVVDLTGITAIASGEEFSLALKNDGTVWTWGFNNYGQLGDGTTTARTSPVQVIGLTGATSIAGGDIHSLSIKSDSTVWAWGGNLKGQLGNSNSISQPTPVLVDSLTGIIGIAAGQLFSIALRNDGTAYAWGDNSWHQLGDGTFSNYRDYPAKMIGLTGIVEISAGSNHSIALKNDGTLWACGKNDNGQLGDSTYLIKFYLTQINGLCSVGKILKASTTQTNNICSNDTIANATVITEGGIPPYSFLWSNGQTTSTATNLSNGINIVAVTDSVNATLVVSVNIVSGASLSKTVTNISCNGGSNGSINLTATGGSGNFLYAWSNGTNNQDISGLAAGPYAIVFTDISCADTLTDTINISEPPVISSSFNTIYSSCGENNGSTSITLAGGTPPYSYLWNNSQTSSTINNLFAGNYTVTANDAMGCIYIASDTVVLQSPPVISTISSLTNVQCNGDNNGSVTVSASSGTPGFSYVWSTSPVQASSTATGLSPGIYTVSTTDTNGCFSIDTAIIGVVYPLTVTANATATIVFQGTPVILSGGGASSYSWTGGISDGVAFTPTFSNTYSVMGTLGSCFDTATISITVKNNHNTIACGSSFSLAICNNGNVNAWGNNIYGELGDGSTTQKNNPIVVSTLNDMLEVAGGLNHSLAVKNDGTAWAWGDNSVGQLGDGTLLERNTPVQVLTNVKSVAAGQQHSLALKNDGTVWAWGKNINGQLGDGTVTQRATPTQVMGLSGIVAIAGGYYHSAALKKDGTVWCWGDDGWGELGNGMGGSVLIPTKVSDLSGIIAIACGENHTLVLKDNGMVFAFGINNNGELGDGTNMYKTTPTQVNNLTGIIAIEAGMSHSMALKSNGTVWTWGLNGSGQLGNGNNVNQNSPVMMSNVTGIIAIEGGAAHSLGLKNDGTLKSCGANYAGQIGDGTLVYRYTPVQVTGLCAVASKINEILDQSAIKIFPNPNAGEFIIEQQVNTQKYTLEIFNTFGEKILTFEVKDQKIEIDLSDQSNGIYFIKISSEAGNTVDKIIVQK